MTPRIVVLGAGYAGLLAAKLTARRTGAPISLVNAHDHFVERVRMHQLACGQQLRELSIPQLLAGTGIEFIADRAVHIDAAQRTVTLAERAEPVPYDLLIYALGSHADLDSVPGARQHVHTLTDHDGAERLHERLRIGGSVAVVGGGLTGIETAAELADSFPGRPVQLVTSGELGATLSRRGRGYLRRALDRLDVQCHDGVRVTRIDADGLQLSDGRQVTADTIVWTTGFQVPALARQAGFAVDDSGRMLVDATLRSVSHPEVYSVGDTAAVRRQTGEQLRMACATALPSAHYATRAIADRLAGREPKPLRFRYFTQCISLGRRDGLIQFVRQDDSPMGAILTGRTAARYKETIVRVSLLAQRRPGLVTLT